MATAYLATVMACVDPNDCYDCGPCGYVGGPNETDELHMGASGVDANNVATIALNTWVKGQCVSEGSSRIFVQYDAGKITSKLAPVDQTLDMSAVMYANDMYEWTGRGIAATTAQLSTLSMRVAFTEGGMTMAVICTSDGGPATCVDETP